MDGIVIKTYSASMLLDDLRETFATLHKYRIKLNPKKCVFGVPAGKLLRVHGLCPRNRSEPRKCPSNCQDARANRYQRRATAHWKTRSTEPLHQQAGRKDLTILPATQERRKIRVDQGSPHRIRRP